jgi:hypothetical protein
MNTDFSVRAAVTILKVVLVLLFKVLKERTGVPAFEELHDHALSLV